LKYRLVLTIANGFNVDELHQVEGDSLVELTSKIPLIIAQIAAIEKSKERHLFAKALDREDELIDDIPF